MKSSNPSHTIDGKTRTRWFGISTTSMTWSLKVTVHLASSSGQYLFLPTVLCLTVVGRGLKQKTRRPHTDLRNRERLQGCRRPNMTPGDVIAIVTYVCLVFSCASVSLRIVVRHKWLDHGLKLEDWLMIVALVSESLHELDHAIFLHTALLSRCCCLCCDGVWLIPSTTGSLFDILRRHHRIHRGREPQSNLEGVERRLVVTSKHSLFLHNKVCSKILTGSQSYLQ